MTTTLGRVAGAFLILLGIFGSIWALISEGFNFIGGEVIILGIIALNLTIILSGVLFILGKIWGIYLIRPSLIILSISSLVYLGMMLPIYSLISIQGFASTMVTLIIFGLTAYSFSSTAKIRLIGNQ
ncbi:MAG: hypothetical protein AABX00_00085 [Nanoarchaeota archaeon]